MRWKTKSSFNVFLNYRVQGATPCERQMKENCRHKKIVLFCFVSYLFHYPSVLLVVVLYQHFICILGQEAKLGTLREKIGLRNYANYKGEVLEIKGRLVLKWRDPCRRVDASRAWKSRLVR